jgi:hypothetical protein
MPTPSRRGEPDRLTNGVGMPPYGRRRVLQIGETFA